MSPSATMEALRRHKDGGLPGKMSLIGYYFAYIFTFELPFLERAWGPFQEASFSGNMLLGGV
jgi:hypothetical protein